MCTSLGEREPDTGDAGCRPAGPRARLSASKPQVSLEGLFTVLGPPSGCTTASHSLSYCSSTTEAGSPRPAGLRTVASDLGGRASGVCCFG